MSYTIFTDGSAHPNPGPGGFGVVVVGDNNKLITTYSKQYAGPVTNNEMELKAILYTMIKYGEKEVDGKFFQPPIVYSDSAYCVNTFNEWMFSWERKGWLKSNNQVPENLDIIKAYYNLYQEGKRIDLRKVKGHSGVEWNELADRLATGKE